MRAVFKALELTSVREQVEQELKALDRKIANLMAVIEAGGALSTVVATVQARQMERDALLARKGAGEGFRRVQRDRMEVERKWCNRVRTAGLRGPGPGVGLHDGVSQDQCAPPAH